jgi:hypothetical protein
VGVRALDWSPQGLASNGRFVSFFTGSFFLIALSHVLVNSGSHDI